MEFSVLQDRTLIRAAGSSRRFALARIVAPKAPPREQRAPINVAFVLDRSGSMQEERKFGLAREAVERALRMLHPGDRFSLVVYDDRVDVLAAATPATDRAVSAALEALRSIDPRGSTDLEAGWSIGCGQLAEMAERHGVSRCLLLSDGLANHGITDRHALARRAGELRRRGVVTSTFGVGADFDELLLRDMAHEGSGNAWFIESATQIPEILGAELGEALEVTMRSTVLTITLPPGAKARPLNRFRFEMSRDERECRIELGDLVSGQQMDAVVELTFSPGTIDRSIMATFEVTTTTAGVAARRESIEWGYASHRENNEEPRNVEVDRAVAQQFAARARAEATEFNRNGDLDRARRVLDRTAYRIEGYAGDDPELVELARSLRRDVQVYAERAMSPMALKMSFYVAESATKGRASSGRARR